MNKKIILATAAIVLLAVSCGKKTPHPASNQPAQESNQPAASQSQNTSLKDLLSLGKAQKCEVSYKMGDGSQSQGTLYIASNKVRGDFSSEVQGKTYTSHMINDGSYIYTWVDGMNGYKFDAKYSQSTNSEDKNSQYKSVDPNAKYDYSCSGWNEDSSLFMPPSNITFSAIMNPNANGGAGSSSGSGVKAQGSANANANACSACDSLSGNAKIQCKAALKCQ